MNESNLVYKNILIVITSDAIITTEILKFLKKNTQIKVNNRKNKYYFC